MMKIFMSVTEVAEELNVSKGYAYQVIREMNEELKDAGYYTIPVEI